MLQKRVFISLARHLRRHNLSSITTPSSVPSPGPVATPSTAKSSASKGSSLIQRLTAFCVGAGIGFGTSFYFIYQELQESNSRIDRRLQKMEERVDAVTKK
jgi:hypothetical protein